MDSANIVRDQLISALSKRHAHVLFEDAIANLPVDLRSAKPNDVPYSIWSLAEHIRITQWDIVEFCHNPDHQSPRWPQGYWPSEDSPTDEQWNAKIIDPPQVLRVNDLAKMIEFVKERDLFTPFPHGSGQNLLREAILIVDHTAYHTGQIVMIRRHFGAWK